jgi:hypothetical protein
LHPARGIVRRWRDTGKPATQFLDPADELQKKDLDFYSGLPNLVEVWRGADRRTLRCFSWTTNPAVAEFFAVHRRGHKFTNPVIGHAMIRKADIFLAYQDRGECEIILDPRRLRKLEIEDVSHIKFGEHRQKAPWMFKENTAKHGPRRHNARLGARGARRPQQAHEHRLAAQKSV